MNGLSAAGFAPDRAAKFRFARPVNAKTELDPTCCWQGVYSHDRRFDGLFFAGIDSTGVYCRSVCPASFGHPANVRWFPSAMAAEAAGFRPCKRCRPDTPPWSSAWFGTLAVVSKALKLISEGALDNDGTLEQLAQRVGIGPRHLRRLFNQHLGTSPLKIARFHRLQRARSLILETKVAISEIASRTGFRSIRQLNHSVLTTFGQSPTQLRHSQGASRRIALESGIVIHLPYRAPFDWSSMIEYLKVKATPGVEAVENNCFRRTVEIGDTVGAIEVWHEADHARLSMRVIFANCERLMQVVQRVRRMFDLEANVVHIAQHLSQDARLAGMLADRPGLRVPGAWDGYELAVRAVLGQGLTVVDKPAVAGRLARVFGRPIQISIRGLSHLFPQPEILADANLTSIGIPAVQAATISSLARAVIAGELNFNSDKDQYGTLSRIYAHHGLNHSAASYIAMRSFGEPDALPHNDLGLRQAFATHGKPVSPAELFDIFKKFKPWRAYAAMHISAALQQLGEQAS
jgi:AraC family transcriptional regulator, regulatory protein of adaptative response / DNA-3-methyladenine glycosylase II